MIIVGAPLVIGTTAACVGSVGLGCGAALIGSLAIEGVTGYAAYQIGGGARGDFFTDLANFINETLTDPDYADLETFELMILPPVNGRRGDHIVILRGYRADGTVVDINTNLSAPEGIANEANELLRDSLIN